MATYFVSDLHFHHKNIIKFTNRPWTFDEQTEELIRRWNAQVRPGDSVYHLGDFTFAGSKKIDEVWNIIKRLNGKKHFIFGNHDSRSLWELIECKAWEENKQNEVVILGDYHEMKINKQTIILSHYPFRTWNKKPYGSFMLFGHVHGDLHIPDERTMDVGIDNHPEHRLFSWDEIYEKLSNIPKPATCHHNKEPQ